MKKGKEGSEEEELSESADEASSEGDIDPDELAAAKEAYNAKDVEGYARGLHAFFRACSIAEKEKSHASKDEEGY